MNDSTGMDRHDYGPLKTFEITWTSGHVERIVGHQVTWPGSMQDLFGSAATSRARPVRVHIHGEIDGQWTLQLSALEEDIRTIRNLATEDVAIVDRGAEQ